MNWTPTGPPFTAEFETVVNESDVDVTKRFFPTRSQSWLAKSSLTNFGFDGMFTRDLFEAQIQLPGATEPLHVFTTHLKCCGDSTNIQRRGAEARAISNFFVHGEH